MLSLYILSRKNFDEGTNITLRATTVIIMPLLAVALLLFPSKIFAQKPEVAVDKTIYLQAGYLFSPRYVVGGENRPVGRSYENLIPLMVDYPEAQALLIEAVELRRKSDKHANRLIYLWLGLTVGLEQMLEHDLDGLVLPAGLAMHAAFWPSIYFSYKQAKEGANAIHRAIWTYNSAVVRDRNKEDIANWNQR